MNHQETIAAVKRTIEYGSTEQILELYDVLGYVEQARGTQEIRIITGMFMGENNELADLDPLPDPPTRSVHMTKPRLPRYLLTACLLLVCLALFIVLSGCAQNTAFARNIQPAVSLIVAEHAAYVNADPTISIPDKETRIRTGRWLDTVVIEAATSPTPPTTPDP